MEEASSGLIIASKKLDSKIKKHQEIVTLAIAKSETVDRLLSKTLADNRVSDVEFPFIMTEFSQYNVLKEAVRARLTRQPSRPDIEKIKKEVEKEFRKKITSIAAISVSFAYNKNMIVCFHLIAFLVNDYLTPEWQKDVRDISREILEANKDRLLFEYFPEC